MSSPDHSPTSRLRTFSLSRVECLYSIHIYIYIFILYRFIASPPVCKIVFWTFDFPPICYLHRRPEHEPSAGPSQVEFEFYEYKLLIYRRGIRRDKFAIRTRLNVAYFSSVSQVNTLKPNDEVINARRSKTSSLKLLREYLFNLTNTSYSYNGHNMAKLWQIRSEYTKDETVQ